MTILREIEASRERWRVLTVYERFEHLVVVVLTGLIALVVLAAIWNLALKIFFALIVAETFDPTEHGVFQAVFGMIFTVIIALEFKRSLLVAVERHESIVQVRAVVLLAMLAILRKIIIFDLGDTDAGGKLLALSAAMLALGVVYWLVREQDRRQNP
jgi:uncharacterized membrane protein (DUF373 family)